MPVLCDTMSSIRQLSLWDYEPLDHTCDKPHQSSALAEVGACPDERLLVNPNRQLAFPGSPVEHWPDCDTERLGDAICIDRPRHDIDGPPHRFVVKCDDEVEVLLPGDSLIYGLVTGINRDDREVCVKPEQSSKPVWVSVERVFPTAPRRGKVASKRRRAQSTVAEEMETLRGRVDVNAVNQQIENQSRYTSLKAVSLVRIGSISHREKLTSTSEATNFFRQYWEQQPSADQERFVVACLDTKHRVQSVVEVTRGTLDASLVHPREVFKPAILEGSAAIILSHNHPSGDPSPSREDHQVTNQLTDAGKLLGVNVLDHIVYGDGTGETVSIRESS